MSLCIQNCQSLGVEVFCVCGFYFGLVFFLVLCFWLWWLDLCFVVLGFFFELYVQKEYFLFTGGDRKDHCPSEKLRVLGWGLACLSRLLRFGVCLPRLSCQTDLWNGCRLQILQLVIYFWSLYVLNAGKSLQNNIWCLEDIGFFKLDVHHAYAGLSITSWVL